jgi:superfamily I DNA/RNA helicase
MTITLNQGQQEASDAFFEFLFSPNPAMIISGPGGVGKTALMAHMIDRVMPDYFATCKMLGIAPEYDSVEMCSTTNKASEVLAVATQRPCGTIHSFMNLKVVDDYATGKSNISKTNRWTVHQRKIVFIDECSMIDTQLLTMLNEGLHKSKIVFVGDKSQLAPVMESISPIYRYGFPMHELTQQMRNNNQPALMDACQQLRETVETGEFKPLRIVPGVIDLLDDQQMQDQIAAHFTEQTHSTRILAYTNARVEEYNQHIRELRKLPPEFTPGEYLINTTACHMKGGMLTVEEEVEITRVSPDITDIEIEPGVIFQVRLVDLQTRIGNYWPDVPLPVDKNHYTALVKHYGKAKNWQKYFNLKNFYPDLRQRDAATIHKSQGSTYDSVFIDLGNVSRCTNPNMAARLLYVALSRARSRVFLYGNLTDRFGGLIT